MSFTDNFGHPKGLLGRLMLVSMDKEHLPMAQWGFSQFEMPPKADILDIGCGGGYNIKRMLSRCPEGKIIGIDISEESVKKARKVNRDEPRVKIILGSVEKMPFVSGRFDLVTAFETVFFWPDTEKNMEEVYRVIRQGGQFAVINNYGDPNIDWEKKVPCMKRYTAEQIGAFMENAGFTDVKVAKKDNLFCVIGGKGDRRVPLDDPVTGNTKATDPDAAEKLMDKKGFIKEELKRQTPQSEMLWKKATDRLREIQRRYEPIPKGVRMHVDKIFPAAAIYLTVKEELGEEKAYSVIENAAIEGCAG